MYRSASSPNIRSLVTQSGVRCGPTAVCEQDKSLDQTWSARGETSGAGDGSPLLHLTGGQAPFLRLICYIRLSERGKKDSDM